MSSLETFSISVGGSKHDNRPKLDTVTWRQFAARFLQPKRTACTMDTCGKGGHIEVNKDGKPIGCRHKDAGYYVPATFATGRKKRDVKSVWFLVVDADHLSNAELAEVFARLEVYQYIAHATHSDRPGDRCVRIVIPLSRPVSAADWPRFWITAMTTLGMPADPSCCDAGRLYYWPARPSDAEYLCEVHDGEPLDVIEIAKRAPAEDPRVADHLDLDDEGMVGEGQRHAMLVSTAGALRARGAGLAEILAALTIANRRCNPPKGDSELADIARWASEQPVGEKWATKPPADSADAAEELGRDEQFKLEPAGKRMGLPISNQKNITLALRKLGVTVRYDTFGDREIVSGLDGYGPDLDDAAMVRLHLLIDQRFVFRPVKEFFYDVISDQARQNSFHPVRDYLDGLRWDGAKRIDRWLIDYAKANDTAFVRAISRIVLVAGVRRVRQPGCKYDEMLVLESEQGTNKSSALGALAGRDDWFTDDLPLGADTKRQMETMGGKWIIEAGELKGMSKGDVAALKSFLSRRVDEARMAYGRKKKVLPRQSIIIGTTNETQGYLKDSTGNRRFWPVSIGAFDAGAIRRDRDQLWAEAAVAEAAGESIRLDPKLYAEAAIEQESRRVDDPFVMLLHTALADLTGKIKIVDCYRIIGIDPGDANQDQVTRLGSTMRELGWDRQQRRFDGKQAYAYVKGDTTERERALEVTGRGEGVTVIPRHASHRGSV